MVPLSWPLGITEGRNAKQELLSRAQQKELIAWLLRQYNRGFPLTWQGAAAAVACIQGHPGDATYEPGQRDGSKGL